MTEKTRTEAVWLKVQDFLKTENPDFPQYHFDGKHKVNIQLPNRDVTEKQMKELIGFVFGVSGAKLLTEIIALAVGKLQTETKNQANANATRAPNAEKTMRDAWLTALANKNFPLAERMLAVDEANAEMYGLKDVQLDKKRKELAEAKSG